MYRKGRVPGFVELTFWRWLNFHFIKMNQITWKPLEENENRESPLYCGISNSTFLDCLLVTES